MKTNVTVSIPTAFRQHTDNVDGAVGQCGVKAVKLLGVWFG